MTKINVLPQSVYNQISAGEVVERPSSVVKELFENAVDAGATEILVSIENGGLTDIFVQDNGSGIPKGEMQKAFLPHATSKLFSASDLQRIRTLGFRGEALASISSVSQCSIASKTKEQEIGYNLSCNGGEFSELEPTPCVEGTSVTVANLFYNTPARLKFMKKPKAEERDVTSMMEKLILANPFVKVRYYADNKLIFQAYGEGIEDAVLAVYGAEFIDNSYLISTEKNGIKIEGFLGSTDYFKANRTYQTQIVNGRWVVDNTITTSIHNAYSSYLMKRQYPVYVIYVSLPSEFVDVNVHPRKTEVRFLNNQVIYGALYSVVSKVLDGSAAALDIIKKTKKEENSIFEQSDNSSFEEDNREYDRSSEFTQKPIIKDFARIEVEKYVIPKVEKKKVTKVAQPVTDFTKESVLKEKSGDLIDDIFRENKAYIEKLEKERAQKDIDAIQTEIETDIKPRLVGQVLSTYLVLEYGKDLIFIDQHAAHERIIFDKFYKMFEEKRVEKQFLIYPYAFRTNAKEFDILFDQLHYFREIGIDIEAADDDLFKVYSVPVELVDINYDAFFRDILTDQKYFQEKIPSVLKEKIIQKACKAAIKSGYQLSQIEIDSLLDMLKNNWGLKCPHGRPVCVKISRTEIDKWFKRIL